MCDFNLFICLTVFLINEDIIHYQTLSQPLCVLFVGGEIMHFPEGSQ